MRKRRISGDEPGRKERSRERPSESRKLALDGRNHHFCPPSEQENVEALSHRVLFFIASSISLSATGAEQNGLQRKLWMTLKHSRQWCLKSIRGFYRLAVRAIDAYSAGLCHGTEEFKHNVYM